MKRRRIGRGSFPYAVRLLLECIGVLEYTVLEYYGTCTCILYSTFQTYTFTVGQTQSHWLQGIHEIVGIVTCHNRREKKNKKNHPFKLELHDHILRSATSVTVKQTAKDHNDYKPCYGAQYYQNQLPCGVFGLV